MVRFYRQAQCSLVLAPLAFPSLVPWAPFQVSGSHTLMLHLCISFTVTLRMTVHRCAAL